MLPHTSTPGVATTPVAEIQEPPEKYWMAVEVLVLMLAKQTYALPSDKPATFTSKKAPPERDTVPVPEGCEERSDEKIETEVPLGAVDPEIEVDTPVVDVWSAEVEPPATVVELLDAAVASVAWKLARTVNPELAVLLGSPP